MHHISTRDLDIEIATFRLCGNLRIKTWTNTPSPDGSTDPTFRLNWCSVTVSYDIVMLCLEAWLIESF